MNAGALVFFFFFCLASLFLAKFRVRTRAQWMLFTVENGRKAGLGKDKWVWDKIKSSNV